MNTGKHIIVAFAAIILAGSVTAQSDNDKKDLKSKEVSMEVSAAKSADIYVENTNRTIEIKVWEQPKVKVVTTVWYEGEGDKLSDAEWFEKLNLNIKALGSSVRVKSGTVSGGSYNVGTTTYGWSSSSGQTSGVAIFNDKGKNVGTKSNLKRIVTIYVPKENKLDIETKYSDVSVTGAVNKMSVDITNGNLDAGDATQLSLRSKYANVSVGNVSVLDVDFMNGRLNLDNVGELDMDTKYANIEIASVKKFKLVSTNDDIEIDNVGTITGRKNYGSFRINKLTGSIELDGTNADVKIRNIATTVDVIKFDNKYADLRIPLKDTKSYTIDFEGAYSSIYGNFEKTPVAVTEKAGGDEATKPVTVQGYKSTQPPAPARSYSRGKDGDNNPAKWTASVGDGKGLKVQIKCLNCTVDFK
jgi:hypothetical protein